MSRIFLASLFLLSTALYSVRAENMNQNSSVWRWTTTTLLDAQRSSQQPANTSHSEFVQRHERYSFNGQPETSR